MLFLARKLRAHCSVISDGRNEKEVVVAKKAKAEKVSGKGDEPKEEEPDDHNLNSKEESDNETLVRKSPVL